MVNQQATRTWGRCVRRLLSFQCNCAASIITAAERWSAVDVERWRVCYAIDTGMPSIPFVLFIVRPGSDNIAPQDSHCCVGNFTAGNSLNNEPEQRDRIFITRNRDVRSISIPDRQLAKRRRGCLCEIGWRTEHPKQPSHP